MGKVINKRMFALVGVVILAMILLTVSVFSCTSEEADTTDAAKIMVAVTIVPQAGFVEAVGGDKVEVVVMVPPGASPHTYEVTPEQMTQLSDAVMYAKVGSPVEFELTWLDKLIAVNTSMLVVDCAQGVELMEMVEDETEEDEDAGLDPHIWLSVKNAMIMVQNICDGLMQVDAANADYYQANCDTYLAELADLDEDLAAGLAGVANRSFIVFHPAFGYFARDYNLNQIAVEQGGQEPDADYIVRLIEEAQAQDIRVVFVSPQFTDDSAETIAREISGEVALINPLAKDFVENMQAIKEAMLQAMT